MNKPKLMSVMALRGFTQVKLAKAIHMSKNTLNAKINGKSQICADEIMDICDALGIDDANTKVEIFLPKSS